MTASALLKKVMDVYPEAFEDLSKPRLKLIKEAILYAGKVSLSDDVLTEDEHKKLLASITGKTSLAPSDRLKAYRLRSDLNQTELSKKCAIPQSNIAAMESGKRPIGITSAKKIARALKCDYRELL